MAAAPHPVHRFTGIDRAPAKAKWTAARRSGACTVHADFFEDELPGAAFDGLLFVESLHLRVGAERGDGGFSSSPTSSMIGCAATASW